MWDLNTGSEVACGKGHEGWIVGIQVSPDDKSIVCIDKNSLRVISPYCKFTFASYIHIVITVVVCQWKSHSDIPPERPVSKVSSSR